MLPSHLQIQRRNDNSEGSSDDEVGGGRSHDQKKSGISASADRRGPVREGNRIGRDRLPPPPLGLTGVLCDSKQLTIPGRGNLHYTVFRPRQLSMKPPLIVVAGGPLLPSHYLTPLVHLITDRSVILYDQIGCGMSILDPSSETKAVDVPAMSKDLHFLIQHLPMESFHLYGHSFGGIIAFECLCMEVSQMSSKKCHSLVLSSTPSSVAGAIHSSENLLNSIRQELGQDADTGVVSKIFASRHECRVEPLPLTLQQSLEMAGFQSSSKGLVNAKNYEAKVSTEDLATMVARPTLVLSGEHDYVDVSHWRTILGENIRMKKLPGCSHYGLHEKEHIYGKEIQDFVRVNDPSLPDIILPNGVRIRR